MKKSSVVFGSYLSLALAAALVCAQSNPPAFPNPDNKDFTIRTTSRLVLLDVSVKNPAGGFVSGLSKDAFHVLEDGKPQEITQFAHADIPVTAGLLVDESGSMRPKKAEVVTAALGFVSASNPQDEMFVLNFNEKVWHGLPDTVLFSDDPVLLRKALWSTTPQGRTALYDAIVAGLKQLDMGRRDKKTLVVISDGGDNISSARMHDVMHMVLDSVATVYTIGIYSPDDPDKNPEVLKRLAQVSGGEFFQLPELDQIVPVCRKIAEDIRNRYTIGYIPNPSGKPLRHIKVVASAPELGKLIVRTRSSYLMNDTETADRTR